MIGLYGPVIFKTGGFPGIPELPSWTFSQFGRERKIKYAVHDIIDGAPIMQHTGRDLETVNLTIQLSSDLLIPLGKNPRVELELLGYLAARGKAQLLVIGIVPVGFFVIEDIRETWKRIANNGSLTAADVELGLKEYA